MRPSQPQLDLVIITVSPEERQMILHGLAHRRLQLIHDDVPIEAQEVPRKYADLYRKVLDA